MDHPCRSVLLSATLICLLVSVRQADAQWYLSGSFGGNYTHPATVSIDQPSTKTAVDYHDVTFAARPFKSPQYYQWQVGRLFGPARRFGLEFEFTHLKVIGNTDATYQTTGEIDGVSVDGPLAMNAFAERYQMTHGLNFLLVNAVVRLPTWWTRATLVMRVGGGTTLPHAETTIAGVSLEQYQYGGPGGDAAAGLAIRLKGPLAAIMEYKLTVARPDITIPEGTGRMWAVTEQLSGGLMLGF